VPKLNRKRLPRILIPNCLIRLLFAIVLPDINIWEQPDELF